MIGYTLILEDRYESHTSGRVSSETSDLEAVELPKVFPEDKDSSRSYDIRDLLIKEAEKKGGLSEVNSFSTNPIIPRHHFDGGFDSNIVDVLSLVFGTGGVLIAYLKVLQPIIIEWRKNRNSRVVRIRRGKTEIELRGVKDFEEAVRIIKELEKDEH